ncbi:hypothetical protein [Lachnoclostridium sp. An181]|nr:hypothetical protein [Lachnoclostridium sp. An181]
MEKELLKRDETAGASEKEIAGASVRRKRKKVKKKNMSTLYALMNF